MRNLTYILILFPLIASAQQHTSSADTTFLNADWEITRHRTQAKYFREIVQVTEDSLLLIHDYYLESKSLQMVGTYIREMKPSNQHGRFKYFYPNGKLKAVYDYKYGIIHGELLRYYDNGQLESLERFDMGTKIDTSWNYFKNGQLRQILVINTDYSDANPSDKYKKNMLVTAYNEYGSPLVINGSGVYKDFYLSGKLKTSIEYEDGFPNGKWIIYSGLKKKKSCVMTFKNGTFIKGENYENGKKDIFSSLQRKAYFPTGIMGLEEFIDQHIGNCEDGFANEVIILISITTTGKVLMDQIISGNTNACQYEEIQMMINNMPRWKPAIYDGKCVEGSHSIKLSFSK